MRLLLRVILLVFTLAGPQSAWGSENPKKTCAGCHAPVAKLATSPTAHKPLRDGHCKWCHQDHGGANTNILHASGGRDLCVICHKTHKADKEERPAHRFQSTRECLACHVAHDSGRKGLLKNEVQELCLSCHEPIKKRLGLMHPHSAAKESCLACHQPHPSGTQHLLNAPRAELCLSCHDLAGLTKAHMGMELKPASCLTCHDPHGGETAALSNGWLVSITLAEQLLMATRAQFLCVVLQELREGPTMGSMANAAFSLLHGLVKHGPGKYFLMAGAAGGELPTFDEC
jgi:predicted CXXCH cytochrome family protein